MEEAIQQAQAGDPFHDITDRDVEDASPELLDHDDENSDEELYHNNVDILFYLFFCFICYTLFFQLFSDVQHVLIQF